MATKALKTARATINRDRSPRWDGADEWSADKFTAHFRRAMEFYRLESSVKELKSKVIDWMGQNGYAKEDIAAFKRTKDSRCGMTMCGVAACLIRGMPEIHEGFNANRDTAAWLRKEIEKVIQEGANDVDDSEDAKPVVRAPEYVVSIQDRIRDQAGQMCEEIDYAIDNWINDPETFDPKAFKMTSLLRTKGAKAAQARYIKGFFQTGYNELLELSSGNADEQLREAYKHRPRKHIKKLIEFYESIMSACDQIAAEAKVMKKPRAKKIKPAEDLVKKIKFKLTDDKLGVASVPAAGIIGAQLAVVYNTKNRKLGVYIAKTSEGLSVKGASIINFTEKSFQKTLRKPPEQLKEFKDQNTQRRVEQWFTKNITTTETLLNGRLNEDVMILKVFK